ncbi:MAG: DNA cytosine methyltransferase [Candidatus Thermoplasmatota archaeon]|nr:DNA cytosine methyltransferase [Candidatus Thermoplasmatota archaeon]
MKKQPRVEGNRTIHTVDLFSGCGGLSLGILEACRRQKLGHNVAFASEWDSEALEIFNQNLNPKISMCKDISELFDGDLRDEKPTVKESNLLKEFPEIYGVDLLTGGPPCQGHSDLNNHSRRQDPRNDLYFRMIRAVQILSPKAIIIENVSTVIHSQEKVVQKSIEILEEMGYMVDQGMIWGNEFGVPQKRKRHFLIASRISRPDMSILNQYKMDKPRTLRWAIEDLMDKYEDGDTYNSSANSSETNRERMNWLLENDMWDLPNHLRPKCHQNGHNYPAVYGRMKWDEPSSTITAGFGSNGQGRFMHPSASPGRTLTPHEAARVQTFPDWFKFDNNKRSTMSKTIGNAVPPLLAMHVAYIALDSL